MKVFSFDRDGTVDVNPLGPDHASVPVEWIQYLAHETEHEVWAHGNQALKEEAGIPGKADLIEKYKTLWGDPIKHVNDRDHKDLETRLDTGGRHNLPDPDLVTAAAEWEKGNGFSKQQYLRLLATVYPDADEYVCVDNQYLGYVDGWRFYYPFEFVDEFQHLDSTIDRLEREIEIPDASQTFEERSVKLTTRVISSVGRSLPKPIRDRFELDPSNRIPVRFRRK